MKKNFQSKVFDLQSNSKTEKKPLKSLAVCLMAFLMGSLGIAASACAPASSNPLNQEPTTTSSFGLDPKNDPVVFTTESGIEIKQANGQVSGSITTTTNTGTTYTQNLSGFYYFTMGTFSGTIYTAASQTSTYTVSNQPVNWLIIGRGAIDFADSSPAGDKINAEISGDEIVVGSAALPLGFVESLPENDDIPDGCILVLSEKLLGQMYFNSSGNLNANLYTGYSPSYLVYGNGYYGNRYRYYGNTNTSTAGGQSWTTSGNKGGDLYNYMNSLMCVTSPTNKAITGSNKLGFTQSQANLIVPQQLYTYYSNGSGYNYAETPSTDGGTYYSLFPLAYRAASTGTKQNFCIEDYLTTNAQRTATFIGSSTNQSYFWWLRSGSPSYSDMPIVSAPLVGTATILSIARTAPGQLSSCNYYNQGVCKTPYKLLDSVAYHGPWPTAFFWRGGPPCHYE